MVVHTLCQEVAVSQVLRRNARIGRDSGLARGAVMAGAAVVLVAGGTVTAALGSSGHGRSALGTHPTPAPGVVAVVVNARGSTVPWDVPLTFAVTGGTLTKVTATATDGTPLPGTLTPTRWASTTTLLPTQTYQLDAVVKNADGKSNTIDKLLRAADATQHFQAQVSPDQAVVGIGEPVVVRFDHAVTGRAARTAVLAGLRVMATPAVAGAWRWYNDYEVHYRGPTFWKSGSAVRVVADMSRVRLPGTPVWGMTKSVTTHFTVGDAFVATVDVTAHVMTVTKDGKLVRTVKVSTGRDKYPTKGGIHIVLLRETVHLYDSSTVGIPTASPDGYYEKLPWSTRISNGGAFVHANPATVDVQGVRNVSHGCVNTSIADAKWFYDNTHLGDIVNIIHAAVPPNRSDAGMADWNYTFTEWETGNLNS
jgi:lipoprotein-anchoring transpeptidase ErfK/SrfK